MASAPLVTLRVDFAPGVRLGPGKADLLEGIRDTGSIAAAGRRMGMSYKRAWMLVETMNAMFAEPLVTSSKGGRDGGGAELTEAGLTVLSAFRAMEEKLRTSSAGEIATLSRLLRPPGD
ncbi:winged helix-turn-helix domain-containing protein [Phreatobacter sp.]|uniref:winged helix-turn-helix domain-containing protein n=1 Tax=Phreatobacter sp. TaxID=1966341 RepID=UPI0025CDC318|nr:winged helix-turn-helix domain-containing protein [Phreatobacter sp.]